MFQYKKDQLQKSWLKKTGLKLLLVVIFSTPYAYNQDIKDDHRFLIQKASNHYDAGQFDAVLSTLSDSIVTRFSESEQVEAYEILSKTWLELAYPEKARSAGLRLMLLNPNYHFRATDRPQFKQLIAGLQARLSGEQTTSVSKIKENLVESPATIISLTAEEIRQRGYLDLEAMLHDLPGFDISRGKGPIYSNIYQRGYRTDSNDRSLLLIDGVEDNDLWSNAMLLSRQYALSNIERVDIIYGPASTMYGANAFQGVINIITRQPDSYIPFTRNWGIQAQVNYGTWNTRYADVTLAGKIAGMAFTLTGRLYQSDEMDLSHFRDWDYQVENLQFYENLFLPQNQTIDPGLILMARKKDSLALAQKLGAKTIRFADKTNDWLVHGKLNTGNLTFGFQTWRREEGSIGWYQDNYRASAANSVVWVPRLTFLYVKYEKILTEQVTLTSFSRFKYHDLDPETNIVNFMSYASGRLNLEDLFNEREAYWDSTYYYRLSQQLRSELNLVFKPALRFNIIGGIEFRTSMIQGDYLRAKTAAGLEFAQPDTNMVGDNYFNILDTGAYIQATYKPESWLKLTLGQRIDYNRVRFSGGYGTVFNSRVAAVATPDKYIFKLIFSQAFKDVSNRVKYSLVPGRRELANPGLNPEQVNNIEISAGCKITRRCALDITGYSAFLNNIAIEQQVSLLDQLTQQYQSVGKLFIRGIQANFNYAYKEFSGYVNYTFTYPLDTEPVDTEGKIIPDEELRVGDIAAHRFNFGLNIRIFENLNLNARLNYVGARKTGANTTVPENPYSQVDPYTIINGTISYSGLFQDQVTVQLIGNNLTNKSYYHPGIRNASHDLVPLLPQNERNVMLRLIYEY